MHHPTHTTVQLFDRHLESRTNTVILCITLSVPVSAQRSDSGDGRMPVHYFEEHSMLRQLSDLIFG